jgi:sugar phosphate isomerase/epimerase
MKKELSVITDEFSNEFDDVIEWVANKNIKWVELRNVWLANVAEMTDQFAADAKDILDDAGLKVSALASPFFKCPPPLYDNPKKLSYSNNFNYNLSKFSRLLDLADHFETKHIRIFGFQIPEEIMKPINDWDSWDVYNSWINAVKELSEKAKARGKYLIAETECGLVFNTQSAVKIFNAVNHPNFSILYDYANVTRTMGPSAVLDEEMTKEVSKITWYNHVKDTKFSDQGHYQCVLGTGDLNWQDFIRWMIQHSPYEDLFWSVETHAGKGDEWNKSVKTTEKLIEILQNV